MTKRWLMPVVLVAALVCAPPLLFAGDNASYPCYTVRDSKRRGCFVCTVTFTPKEVQWKGKSLVIGEAWVERQTERAGPLRLLPVYKTIPGYYLCFNLSQGWDVLNGTDGPCFALEVRGHSFGQIGTVVLCEELKNLDRREFTVLCSGRSKDEKDEPVRIKVVLELQTQQTKPGPGSP